MYEVINFAQIEQKSITNLALGTISGYAEKDHQFIDLKKAVNCVIRISFTP